MMYDFLRPSAAAHLWPWGGTTLPNANRRFFPTGGMQLSSKGISAGIDVFGKNVDPLLLSVLKTRTTGGKKRIGIGGLFRNLIKSSEAASEEEGKKLS